MAISDVIRPGNKIDIRVLQQLNKNDRTGENVKVYKSQLLDIKDNGILEVAMPSESGKLILLQLGVRYEFTFFASAGMYRAIVQVKERYRKDNMYMLEVVLRSRLEKVQRREFYRYPCMLDIFYYLITPEEAQLESGDAIFVRIRHDVGEERKEYSGLMVDLSGGGSRFYTNDKLESGQLILIGLHLKNELIDKQYFIVGNVVGCFDKNNDTGRKYEIRLKFQVRDDRIREEIIKYIFEEERLARQRGSR